MFDQSSYKNIFNYKDITPSVQEKLGICVKVDIDILEALPKSNSNYPAEYINKQLPLMMSRIEKKRKP